MLDTCTLAWKGNTLSDEIVSTSMEEVDVPAYPKVREINPLQMFDSMDEAENQGMIHNFAPSVTTIWKNENYRDDSAIEDGQGNVYGQTPPGVRHPSEAPYTPHDEEELNGITDTLDDAAETDEEGEPFKLEP